MQGSEPTEDVVVRPRPRPSPTVRVAALLLPVALLAAWVAFPDSQHAVAAGFTLIVLLLLAGTADLTGRPGAVALAVVSVVWLLVNSPMEGLVVLTLSRTHGVTMADFAGLAGLGLAAWRFSTATRGQTAADGR